MTEWQPITTDPNDGNFRFYGLHVHARGLLFFEAHYVALNEAGQLVHPSGDNFDDWTYDDFEVWAEAPAPLDANGECVPSTEGK